MRACLDCSALASSILLCKYVTSEYAVNCDIMCAIVLGKNISYMPEYSSNM